MFLIYQLLITLIILISQIIILVIIFNLIIFKANGDDQISFDVSEIEILDGGDKIIGKNRGIITTNDGVTITADEFLFDKIKTTTKAVMTHCR